MVRQKNLILKLFFSSRFLCSRRKYVTLLRYAVLYVPHKFKLMLMTHSYLVLKNSNEKKFHYLRIRMNGNHVPGAGGQAISDTGTSFIVGPGHSIAAIASLTGAKWDDAVNGVD